MAKVILTADECERFDAQSDDQLRRTIELNERKRRAVKKDQKAYAEACRDLTSMLEAQTDYAIEVLEKRELAAGAGNPPGPVLVPPDSTARSTAKKRAAAS